MKNYFSQNNNLEPPPELPVKKGFKKFGALIPFFAGGVFFLFIILKDFKYSGYASEVVNKIINIFFYKGVFLYLAACFFLLNFIRYLKFKKIVSDVPTSRIRSASMGMTELKGTASRKYNLLSPSANIPCIFYRVKKYRKKSSAETSGWSWYETITSGHVPFYLEDDTGRVTVYPVGAEFFPLKKEVYCNTGGISASGMFNTVPVNQKWQEEVILDNSPVYVLGWAEYPVGSDKSKIKKIRLDILRKLKKSKKELMKYDADQNGEIDQYEWEQALKDADKKAYEQYLNQENSKKNAFVVLDPPFKGFPMIIAPTKAEDKIINRYKLYTLLNFAALVISTVWGSILMFGG